MSNYFPHLLIAWPIVGLVYFFGKSAWKNRQIVEWANLGWIILMYAGFFSFIYGLCLLNQ